jgi:hypothetical protein
VQKWGVSTGRTLYSMPWLVGLINCRDDAKGDLAIGARSYLHRFLYTSGPRIRNNESAKATEEERNIRQSISF